MAITGISALSGQQIIASGACSARSAATASYTTGGNDIQGLYTTVNSNSGNWNTPIFPRDITANSLHIENNGDITLLQLTGDDSDDYAQTVIRGSGIEFINGQTDPTVVGTIAGNDISNWNSTYNTVSTNSGSWIGGGGGGVDSATVSAIASSYAESAVSSKLDTSAQVVTSTASAYDMDGYAWTTEINGLEISAARAYSASYANTAETAYSADFASSSDKATYDTDGRLLSSLTDSATVSAIASSYAESAASGKLDSTAFSTVSGDFVTGTATGTAFMQNGTAQAAFTGITGVAGMPIIATTLQAAAIQDIGGAKFFYGPSAKPFSTGTGGIYAPLQYATGACLAMSAGASQQNNRAYYKANEWFVSDSGQRNGAVRAEVHNTRGTHISGALPNNDGFDLLTSGLKFFSGSTTSVVDPASIGRWNSAYDQLGNVTALLDSL